MFMKQGVGGEAGTVKKGACIGRDRINQGGGFCRQPKKVKTYGRMNMNVGVGSPQWVALSGVNIVYGV